MNANKRPEATTVRRVKRGTITIRVHTRIYGKPRLKLGVWLIKLGVLIARVQVRVWTDEDRNAPRVADENNNLKDTLAVIGIIVGAGVVFWIGWGLLDYIGWGV